MINWQKIPSWVRVIATLFSVLFPYWLMRSGWFRFPWTFIVIIAFIALWALLTGITARRLGFIKVKQPARLLLCILLLTLVLELVMDWLIQPGINQLWGDVPDYSYFDKLRGNLPGYLRLLLFMLVSAAIGEELLFRSFMFHQLEQILPAGKYRNVLVCLVPAALFGWAHAYEGPAGIAVTSIWGILFGVIYMRTRNSWLVMGVHACIDVVFLTLAYTGNLSYYEWPARLLW